MHEIALVRAHASIGGADDIDPDLLARQIFDDMFVLSGGGRCASTPGNDPGGVTVESIALLNEPSIRTAGHGPSIRYGHDGCETFEQLPSISAQLEDVGIWGDHGYTARFEPLLSFRRHPHGDRLRRYDDGRL